MPEKKVIPIEDRIPKLKQQRRQKANRRFIFYITVFFILILAVIYFESPLSTISKITIEGNHYTPKQKVLKESGLSTDSHYWDIEPDKVAARIEKLPTVQSVDIQKVFPSNVTIKVKEFQRIAYLDKDGSYIPILENGSLLPRLGKGQLPINAPLLIGWKQDEHLKNMAKQLSKSPQAIIHNISEIHPAPKKGGDETVMLYMNNGLKILANISNFSEKILAYPGIAEKLPKGTKGIVHLQVGAYFKPDQAQKKEGAGDEKK
ncbi:cell division protein FtsQ [Scopulibacillus darangshiensis]|uniref:Cell division protein DivIB n=1 Tax=Scopulibacillus darangshiensis TaxID=442528 RepID=A0A4R2P2X8_9BACL|nr:FtsQ-type POTRA domain-containing protein [Scopulibacillus darangshiensis]TCP29093.1 cell division protein FtsQ [Scopulibacillus darangshiensis]